MRVFWQDPDLECDECGKKLNDSEAVLIGEHSHEFEEDTRQATVCVHCIKKALQMIKNTYF